MGHRLLSLFLTLSLSTFFTSAAAAPPISNILILDANDCTNLHCEWQGDGEKCTFVSTLEKGDNEFSHEWLKDGEQAEHLLERMKRRQPMNTFTIVNKFETGKMCKRRRLACHMSLVMSGEENYMRHLRDLQDPRLYPNRKPC